MATLLVISIAIVGNFLSNINSNNWKIALTIANCLCKSNTNSAKKAIAIAISILLLKSGSSWKYFFDYKKHFLHLAHLNGFSPVWILSCFSKVHTAQRVLSHFNIVSGDLLNAKELIKKKLFLHLGHWNGFSPVWILSYFSKVHTAKRGLSHFKTLYLVISWMQRNW